MSSVMNQGRKGFFSLPSEIRNIVYESYVTGLTVTFSSHSSSLTNAQINFELQRNSLDTLMSIVLKYSEDTTVFFEKNGDLSQTSPLDPQNLVALFRTCRQIAKEGGTILISKAQISFHEGKDFIDGYNSLTSTRRSEHLATDLQLGDVFFHIIKLEIMLAQSEVFEALHSRNRPLDNATMFHIMGSAMPSLKHLALTIYHFGRCPYTIYSIPHTCFLRGLFQLRSISTFKMHYFKHADHKLFYAGGIDGKRGYGVARALQETLQDEIQNSSEGEGGLLFPGGLLRCSDLDVYLTVGQAMVEKLDDIMCDIDVNEDPDDPRNDDEEQEEFEYYYNIYRDIQENMEDMTVSVSDGDSDSDNDSDSD